MEIFNYRVKLFIILFFTVNLYSVEFIKINDEILIDLCDISPNSSFYEWNIVNKPDNSILVTESINTGSCYTSFIPDLTGIYEIEFNSENYNNIFKYVVLESLEKSGIDIIYILGNEFYYDNLEYYTDYEANELIFNMEKKLKSVNFKINGFAKVKDLETNETFIINTENDNYLKDEHLYEIVFYPDGFFKSEKIINTANIDDINILPFDDKIEISVKDSDDKDIKGTITTYTGENGVRTMFLNDFNKYVYIDDAEKILFSPLKEQNNYPSFMIEKESFEGADINSLEFKYDDIQFNTLRINIGSLENSEFITVIIKSVLMDKCLVNLVSTGCFYQKSLMLNRNTEIRLPNGEYEISAYRKGYVSIKKTVNINSSEEITLTGFQKTATVDVRFPEDLQGVSFDGSGNNNYYFNIDGSFDTLKIPEGTYDVTMFTEYGIFNVKSLVINDNTVLEYRWRKINIKIKENNKIKYGGIVVVNNRNYVFNNGSSVEFYIEK